MNMYFLRDNAGRLILPGSSLKGMLRSVAEAVSNSCLSQLAHPEAGRLDYRSVGITQELRQGIILKVPKDADDYGLLVELDGKNVAGGWDTWVMRNKVENLEDAKPYDAWIENRVQKQQKKGKSYSFKETLEVDKTVSASRPDATRRQAFLKKTGKNIPNKKAERLFYSERAGTELVKALDDLEQRVDDLRQNPHNASLNPHGLTIVEFTYTDALDYNTILKGQKERAKQRSEQEDRPRQRQGDQTAYQLHDLKKGDLVYWRKVSLSTEIAERAEKGTQ
jgi:CRISPR/Cas system CSM-associated protein Csm3 (group 7 of RAMP superfamily)